MDMGRFIMDLLEVRHSGTRTSIPFWTITSVTFVGRTAGIFGCLFHRVDVVTWQHRHRWIFRRRAEAEGLYAEIRAKLIAYQPTSHWSETDG
jgi:hypothetical protein